MRILYMGTPEIAVAGLDALLHDGQEISAVVTSPDKPAGRGRQTQKSPVKVFAEKNGLKVLQPPDLKSPEFLRALQGIAPELIVVVAFRMLPEAVWSLPPRGTINLHASLLPHYRGAAPINRAIMNGETETGVSTFFIEKDMDTGRIILQEPVPIHPDDNAGKLHDRIMEKGTGLLIRTVHSLEEGNVKGTPQSDLVEPGTVLKTAPKIFREDCRIVWGNPLQTLYDHIRGLSPYPGAWTTLISPENKNTILKVFHAEKVERDSVYQPGTVLTDGKTRFEVVCLNGILNLKEVQLEGRNKMEAAELLHGMKDPFAYRLE